MTNPVGQTLRECSAAGDLEQGLYSSLYRRDGDGNRIPCTPEHFDEVRARYDRNWGPFQLNQGGSLSWTVLQSACYDGNVAMVRHIIQLGQTENVDVVNFGGNEGVTPLITVVDCPHPDVAVEIARMLIDAGADVNVCSNYIYGSISYPGGITPVYLATLHAKERLVKLFLEAGAIVNPKIEQFKHDQSGCMYCHEFDPTQMMVQELFEIKARDHLKWFRERIGHNYGKIAWTTWTNPMLDVANRIGRVVPESLSLLAAIGIRQSQHEGNDLLKKGEEQGIILPKMLDPYLKMAEKLICERAGSSYLERGGEWEGLRLPLWRRRF